tara:strand:- start:255 stop:524 length:270 start_codon:yes stop_codon:yes gene_type:complete
MKNTPHYTSRVRAHKVTDKVLLLVNDDYNTFDHVIECLVSLCDHNPIQAEQCAYLAHYHGNCEILVGEVSYLELVKNDLILYGLDVKII